MEFIENICKIITFIKVNKTFLAYFRIFWENLKTIKVLIRNFS